MNTKNNNSQVLNNPSINNLNNRNSVAVNINMINLGGNSTTTNNQPIKFDEKLSTNFDGKNIFSNDEKEMASSKYKNGSSEFQSKSKG